MGLFFIDRLPVNLLPEVVYPLIRVNVDYPGASPEVVEEQVTRPLERALSSTEDLIRMSSEAEEGRTDVSLIFEYGTDLDTALQNASRLLERARASVARRRRAAPSPQMGSRRLFGLRSRVLVGPAHAARGAGLGRQPNWRRSSRSIGASRAWKPIGGQERELASHRRSAAAALLRPDPAGVADQVIGRKTSIAAGWRDLEQPRRHGQDRRALHQPGQIANVLIRARRVRSAHPPRRGRRGPRWVSRAALVRAPRRPAGLCRYRCSSSPRPTR